MFILAADPSSGRHAGRPVAAGDGGDGNNNNGDDDERDDGYRVFLSQTHQHHRPLSSRGSGGTPLSNGTAAPPTGRVLLGRSISAAAAATTRGGPTNFAGAFEQPDSGDVRMLLSGEAVEVGGGGAASSQWTSQPQQAPPSLFSTANGVAGGGRSVGALTTGGLEGVGRSLFDAAPRARREGGAAAAAAVVVAPSTTTAASAAGPAATTTMKNNFPNFLRVVDATNTNPFLPPKARKHGRANARRPLTINGKATISRYIKNFEELSVIGAGSFSDVFRCRSRVDGCTYAGEQRRESVGRRSVASSHLGRL